MTIQKESKSENAAFHSQAITFTPRSAEDHMIEIKFNGITVPGSPFRCKIIDASRVSASGEERVPVNKVGLKDRRCIC